MAITLDGTNGITTPDLTVDTDTLVVDEANNRVGIGTASPAAKLVSAGSSATNFKSLILRNGDGTTGSSVSIDFETSTGTSGDEAAMAGRISGLRTGGGTSGALTFSTTSNGTLAERARIDSSGNLLVGTTSNPYTSRQVLAVASGTTLTCMSTTATSYNAAIFNYNTSTQVGYIACTSSATAYVTSSDYRLKENVRPLTGALGRVALLKPCTYTWKSAPNEIGEGFIAHELAEVCPQAVSGEKDAVNEDGSIKPQGIDTSFLVATLTAAIQEQQALITAQQTAIETLEARVAALEAA